MMTMAFLAPKPHFNYSGPYFKALMETSRMFFLEVHGLDLLPLPTRHEFKQERRFIGSL